MVPSIYMVTEVLGKDETAQVYAKEQKRSLQKKAKEDDLKLNFS